MINNIKSQISKYLKDKLCKKYQTEEILVSSKDEGLTVILHGRDLRDCHIPQYLNCTYDDEIYNFHIKTIRYDLPIRLFNASKSLIFFDKNEPWPEIQVKDDLCEI